MKKFKLLFTDHTPFTGGAQLALRRHLQHLAEEFEAVVCVGAPEVFRESLRSDRSERFKILSGEFDQLKPVSGRSFLRLFKSSFSLGRAVFRERPDLLLANTERSLYPTFLVALVLRIPLVVFLRDFEFSRPLLKWVAKKTAVFICVSRAVRDFYFPRDFPKARVVYVGTDLEGRLAAVTATTVTQQRRRWGLENCFVIGFVGRLVRWKGPLLLVEIAQELLQFKDLPPWKTVVVGEGVSQTGSVETELGSRIRRAGLEDFFRLVGFTKEVAVWYRIFDVFWHTSLSPEPFATVVVESLAAGVPVIATDLGGSKEVIEDGRNGFRVSPAAAREFAVRTAALMRDPSLYQSLRQAALQSAADFAEDKITAQIEAIYREVLVRRR